MTAITYRNIKKPIIPPGDLPMLALFARGEQGAWYDPSDLYNYMAAGEEMIPDPRFSTPASWVLDPAHTIENGTLLFNATSGGQVAEPAGEIRTIAGLTYEVVIDLTRTSGSFLVRGFGVSYIQSGSTQRVVQHLVGNGGVIGLRTYSGGVAEVREFSVRPVHGIGQATMFQDADGTIPVTSVEQPVGLILDKSGNGNHASQLTAPARPMLSARVNLLSNSRSASSGTLANATAIPQPEGGFKLVGQVGVNRGRLQFPVGVGDANTITVWARAGEWNRLVLGVANGGGIWSVARFNLETGEYEGTTNYSTDRVKNPVIVQDGDFWRCSVSRDVGTQRFVVMPFGQAGDPINPSPAMVGDGVSGIYIERMQVEHSPAPTRYQDVRSPTDYDWQGWPLYLTSDGVDDALSANGAGLAMDRDVGTTLACGYEYGYLSSVTSAANVVSLGHSASATIFARLGQRADSTEGRVASANMRNSNGLTPAVATASVSRNIKPNTFEVGVVRTRGQTIRHRLRDGAEAVAEFTGDASLATSKIDMFSPGQGVRRIFGALVVMRELDDSEVGRLTNFLTERATRATA